MGTYNTYQVSNSGHIVFESDESDIVVTYRGATFNVFRALGNDVWENVTCFTNYEVSDLDHAKQIAQECLE